MSKWKDVKKVVLAYSGGLDTSIILKWLQTELGAEVVTFTADLGQGGELEPARKKAEMMGIKLSGFIPSRSYLVRFQDDPRVLTMTGEQLNQDGVLVKLPETQSAEIVYVDPLQ